tara:strand:- start:50 stop:463 length:414 start_codon:yes stop_codon:yes gene_type:complete
MTKALLVKTDRGHFLPIDNAFNSVAAGELIEVNFTKRDSRTLAQNNALHLYFKHLSTALNDGGFTVEATLSKPLNMPWNENLVKELIWKPIQAQQTSETSTAKLNVIELSFIYDVLNDYLSTTKGIHVPFPSRNHHG